MHLFFLQFIDFIETGVGRSRFPRGNKPISPAIFYSNYKYELNSTRKSETLLGNQQCPRPVVQ